MELPRSLHAQILTPPKEEDLGFTQSDLIEMAGFVGTDEQFLEKFYPIYPRLMKAAFNPSSNIAYSFIRGKVLPPLAAAFGNAWTKPPIYGDILREIPRACEHLQDDRLSDKQRRGLFGLVLDVTSLRLGPEGTELWEDAVFPLMRVPAVSNAVVPDLGELLTRESPSYYAERLIREYMGAIGLGEDSYYEVRQAWVDSCYQSWNPNKGGKGKWEYDKKKEKASIRHNLNAMVALEDMAPGSIQVLSHDYNIRAFARYHTEQMIRQVEHTGDPGPTFMTTVARDDHNGAFSDLSWMEKFSQQLEEVGVYHRVYEAGKGEDVIRGYAREHAKNRGPSLVGSHHIAHGSPYGMTLARDLLAESGFGSHIARSSREGAISLARNSMDRGLLQRMRERYYLPNHPVVFFNSCSVGAGLTPHIAQATGMRTIASQYPISGFSLSVTDTHPLAYEARFTEHVNKSEVLRTVNT